MVGVKAIFAPLVLDPSNVPPVGTLYHPIEAPAAVAFNVVDCPAHIDEGKAVTLVGKGHCASSNLLDNESNKVANNL